MRDVGRKIVFTIAAIVLVAVLASIADFLTSLHWERTLTHDFKTMSGDTDASRTELIHKQDLICFNQSSGFNDYRQEFLTESKRLNEAFTTSLESCGLGDSCCNNDSDIHGMVGLVSAKQIRCVDVRSVDLYLKPNKPFCVTPQKLTVRIKNVTSRDQQSARYWSPDPAHFNIEVGAHAD